MTCSLPGGISIVRRAPDARDGPPEAVTAIGAARGFRLRKLPGFLNWLIDGDTPT